ncbi:MAG TPA: hypothetical protein VGF23_20490 [Gaiellaceae bacterium]
MRGSSDVSVTATPGLLAVRLDGPKHAYKPKLAWMGQSVPVTLSGGANCGNRQSVYVLGGAAWANDDSPPPSDSFLIEGSADWTIPGGLPATEHMHWVFTPRGG